jgi:hypothetical protein
MAVGVALVSALGIVTLVLLAMTALPTAVTVVLVCVGVVVGWAWVLHPR